MSKPGKQLEHIPDPLDLLKISHGLLNDGGIISIVVPNDFNPIQKALTEKLGFSQWWVSPLHHINYFNMKSLTDLLSQAGYKILHTTTTFPIDMFLLMGENYVGNDVTGRSVHSRRKTLELNMAKAGATDLRLAWYKSMSDLGMGRELLVYARKSL